jgi:hypothetical protein
MSNTLIINLSLSALYVLFLLWYGGKGKPLSLSEIRRFETELGKVSPTIQGQATAELVRRFAAQDDGGEFVMHNLVRYRAKALYPARYAYGDSVRAADQRYGRAVLGPMLRRASIPLFVAKCGGRFIQPDNDQAWNYVAMVRYRSRRDFLHFALEIESQGIAVHKWAAIEETHITPLSPLVSLFFARGVAGAGLALLALALNQLLG